MTYSITLVVLMDEGPMLLPQEYDIDEPTGGDIVAMHFPSLFGESPKQTGTVHIHVISIPDGISLARLRAEFQPKGRARDESKSSRSIWYIDRGRMPIARRVEIRDRQQTAVSWSRFKTFCRRKSDLHTLKDSDLL